MHKNKWPIFILLLKFLTSLDASASFDHSYKLYGEILAKVIVDSEFSSKVNYSLLSTSPAELDRFLAQVEAVKRAEYDSWSEAEKITFLINSYNAFTLKLVAQGLKENPTLKSIRDLGGIFSSPWKKRFFQFLGEKSHLDRIEHELARGSFDEPRMHFAFNCASIGCPKLNKTPFLPKQLDVDLEAATAIFLRDQSRNRYNEANGRLEISSLFKWYRKDFDSSKKISSVYELLEKHMSLPKDILPKLKTRELKIDYLDYDWALNRIDP